MAEFYNRFAYDPASEVGATIERLDTGLFWEGSAWAVAEPKPTLMTRKTDAKKAAEPIRYLNLDLPDVSFPPGDFYCLRVYRLDDQGEAVELLELLPQRVVELPQELKFYAYATGSR